MKIILSKQAWRQYRQYHQTKPYFHYDLKHAATLVVNKPTPEWLRVHSLKNSFKGYKSFSLENDLRVVFKEIKGGIFIANIGTHDEVY